MIVFLKVYMHHEVNISRELIEYNICKPGPRLDKI